MQVHLLAKVTAALACINELTREPKAVADVVGTATPFPIADASGSTGLVRVVARTGLNASFAASSRYTMRHRCTRYCVNEGRFPAA